jgi:hypothetical protein
MHPTDAQIEAYAARTLPPVELLEVDDHLAQCDACRRRAAARAGLGRGLASLREAAVAAPTAPRRGWSPAAYAAAAALVAGFAFLFAIALRSGSPAVLAGLDALPREYQDRVRTALQARVAEPPAILAELRGRAGTLMGAGPRDAFGPIEPLATVTLSDRPTFRWQPLPGAESYTVTLADDGLRPIAQSPPLSGTDWTPADGLPRGRVYVWQVTARRGAETRTAPAPPAPLARFGVVDQETARAIEKVAREHAGSHLLLGILHAQAGVTAEALRHLEQVPAADPHYATARRTIERLAAPDVRGGR